MKRFKLHKMSFKKIFKPQQKFKLFLLIILISTVVITVILLKFSSINQNYSSSKTSNAKFLIAQNKNHESNRKNKITINQSSSSSSGVNAGAQVAEIIPEKYNEHDLKERLIKDKIKYLLYQKEENNNDLLEKSSSMKPSSEARIITKHVHIFYIAPVPWYKKNKKNHINREELFFSNKTTIFNSFSKFNNNSSNKQSPHDKTNSQIINVEFYPSLGFYESKSDIIKNHFEEIKRCGIAVVIVPKTPSLTENHFKNILSIAAEINISVTVEFNYTRNSTVNVLKHHLNWLEEYSSYPGLYKVYSLARNEYVPLIYIANAYNIPTDDKGLCDDSHHDFLPLRKSSKTAAIYIGHIKSKKHAELMRRLCFNGFYTRIPSNGATFGSTWKNWSFLKNFAQTYKMIFIPTIGPGFSERGKPPRHGNIQRYRSNGRYYGVAWRTAILNHISFISLASFNNWRDGTQIEPAVPRMGFTDYTPGKPTKYLDLTMHWVENFVRTKSERLSDDENNCYEFYNNTIC